MYAIVSTGGKQYRVERGQTLLVERLPVGEGESCTLQPLLYVDGEQVVEGGKDGSPVRVEARVVAHERGPKLRVVKFKPKRGYRRRTGHRQHLTRIEITAIEAGGERPRRRRTAKEGSEAGAGSSRTSERRRTSRSASAPDAEGDKGGGPTRSRAQRTASERKEESDGS